MVADLGSGCAAAAAAADLGSGDVLVLVLPVVLLMLLLMLLLQDEQLEQLWWSHMRIMEMNHPVFDPHPMLSDSYKVFMMQVGRRVSGRASEELRTRSSPKSLAMGRLAPHPTLPLISHLTLYLLIV
jgi:hypothetical protein